jgi:hypothetical protein
MPSMAFWSSPLVPYKAKSTAFIDGHALRLTFSTTLFQLEKGESFDSNPKNCGLLDLERAPSPLTKLINENVLDDSRAVCQDTLPVTKLSPWTAQTVWTATS